MIAESNQSPIHIPQLRIFEDPYIKVRIDATDHRYVYYKDFSSWAKSTTNYQTDTWDHRTIVGSHAKKYASTIDFTSTVKLPYTGLYVVLISYLARPGYNGNFTFYDGSTQIEDTTSFYSKYDQFSYKMYPIQHFTSGNHSFKVTVNKTGYIRDIIIYPVTRWEGDSDGITTNHNNRLDLDEVEFTQNSVVEINNCNITLPLREEYFLKYDWYTPYAWTYDDIITVWMGEERNKTSAMFGGYVSSVKYSNDELNIGCKDRLFDLDRIPLYSNFTIGGAATTTGSTRPSVKFPNVYSLVRYLAEYSRYPLMCYNVPYDFAVHLNFDNIGEYNTISTGVWNKTYDTKNGYPAPSMKLTLGSSTGTGYAYLYNENSDPYDATDYNYLSLDYYSSGCGARYPLPWNFIINMTDSDSVTADYSINVSNGTGIRPLTSYKPILNGTWQRMTFDIESLFKKYGLSSSEYIINSVRLEGTVTDAMLSQRACSSLWVGGLYAYKSINHAPKYASQEVKTPFEEIQQICDRTNHAAYVVYGDGREEDILVCQPTQYTTASIGIDEDDNLLELVSTDDSPLDDDFCNYRHMTFNFKNNKAGSGYKWDTQSIAHYREKQVHDFNSDINNQADANTDISNYLANHKWPKLGFTVKIMGTSQLIPEQYCAVSIPSHHINGSYPVKTITHNWSKDGGYYTTVDFEKASNRFKKLIGKYDREIKNLAQRNQSNVYSTGTSDSLGIGSPGAFSEI